MDSLIQCQAWAVSFCTELWYILMYIYDVYIYTCTSFEVFWCMFWSIYLTYFDVLSKDPKRERMGISNLSTVWLEGFVAHRSDVFWCCLYLVHSWQLKRQGGWVVYRNELPVIWFRSSRWAKLSLYPKVVGEDEELSFSFCIGGICMDMYGYVSSLKCTQLLI